MIVRENINFERGIDPKQAMGTGLVKTIEKMGVRFHFNWDGGEIEREKYIENVGKFYQLIIKLVEVGVKPEDMEISHGYQIDIRSYRVIRYNHSLFHCLTEIDANIIINILCKFTTDNTQRTWTIEQDSGLSGTNININDDHTWIDNIIENREKYSEIS